MILRHHYGFVVFFIVYLSSFAYTDVIDTSVLSTPSDASLHSIGNSLQEEHLTTAVENLGHFTKRILGGLGGGRVKSHRRKKKTKFVQRRQDSSITGGNVVVGARDLGSRIDTTLNHIRDIIPEAIESVESDIAISNRDKVILALANFLGMVFGILKTTGGATDWNEVSDGNKIQVFAQILYGYGYWGPFALEYEDSYLTCNSLNLDEALEEYSYVTNYNRASLNPVIASYFTTELNGKIKENLYCLISRSSGNQEANELDTYINVYTQLLSENIAAQA